MEVTSRFYSWRETASVQQKEAFQDGRTPRGLILVTPITPSISFFNKNFEVLFFKVTLIAKGISEQGKEERREGRREGGKERD